MAHALITGRKTFTALGQHLFFPILTMTYGGVHGYILCFVLHLIVPYDQLRTIRQTCSEFVGLIYLLDLFLWKQNYASCIPTCTFLTIRSILLRHFSPHETRLYIQRFDCKVQNHIFARMSPRHLIDRSPMHISIPSRFLGPWTIIWILISMDKSFGTSCMHHGYEQRAERDQTSACISMPRLITS